jgi:hypothetical protein
MFDEKGKPEFNVGAAIERFRVCSKHEAFGIVRMIAEYSNARHMGETVRFLMEAGSIPEASKLDRERSVELLARRLLARHWLSAVQRSENAALLAEVIRFYGINHHCFPFMPERDMDYVRGLAYEACLALCMNEHQKGADPQPALIQQRVDAARIAMASGWYKSRDASHMMPCCYLPELIERLANSVPNHGPEIKFRWRWEGLPVSDSHEAWREAAQSRSIEDLRHDSDAIHTMCELTANGNGQVTSLVLAKLNRARWLMGQAVAR